MRNKYKFIAVSATLVAVLSFGTIAFAHETTGTSTDSTTGSTTSTNKSEEAVRTAKLMVREAKAKAMAKIYQNQIDRAQKALDKLQIIIDRIKAQRAKMTTTSTTDLAAIDALITKAETQKTTVQTDLNNIKAKAAALQAALTTTSASTTTLAPKQPVKDFQTSVKILKKDTITLHNTLKQIVKQMKSLNKPTKSDDNESSTPETEETH